MSSAATPATVAPDDSEPRTSSPKRRKEKAQRNPGQAPWGVRIALTVICR